MAAPTGRPPVACANRRSHSERAMLASIVKVVVIVGAASVVCVLALTRQASSHPTAECSVDTLLQKRVVPDGRWVKVGGVKGWMKDKTVPEAAVDMKRLTVRLTSDDLVVELDLESVLLAIFPNPDD